MPSLAAPRGQKKWVLLPRGKPLYEDSSSFGTRMLTKMGWSQGKGLGANEDGSQNFIHVKYKNDVGGIGFEHRDDQWTEHENVFNSLLQKLSTDKSDNPETTSDPKSALSGESLEVKSKQSRARVHYQKFTRGKDLTRYSEKDLANIFGKKSLGDGNSVAKDLPFGVFKDNVNNIKENTEERAQEESFGITTINTGTSLNDYFKEKMEKRKRKQGAPTTEQNVNNNPEIAIESKISKKKKKERKTVNETEQAEINDDNKEEIEFEDEVTIKSTKKKSKKSKKRKDDEQVEETVIEDVLPIIEEMQPEIIKVKKSKKKRKKLAAEEVQEIKDIKLDEIKYENVSEIFNKKRKLSIDNVNEENSIDPDTENLATEQSANNDNYTEEGTMDINKINTDNKNKTIITINWFLNEKFRYLDVDQFINSNLCNIVGYGIDDDFDLKVIRRTCDDERIFALWNKALKEKLEDYKCKTITKLIKRKKFFQQSRNIQYKRKEKLFKFM